MTDKKAKADVTPVRQRTQYTCMSTSLMMCLQALGHKVTEDEVNDVMGARPKKGAAWEHALAAAQHYGCRATLVTPSTVQQLKSWTDRGIPVMIAWNPEGRPWSHASVVFDVDDDLNVYVADPNIPDPDETVRIVPKGEFYSKWAEKWPDYIVRRPAMAVEREITPDGRQVIPVVERTTPDGGLIPVAVMASAKKASSKLRWKHKMIPDRFSYRGTRMPGGDEWTAETKDITYRIYSAHFDGDFDDPKRMHRGLVLRITYKNPWREDRKKFVKEPADRRAMQYAQKHYDEHLNPPAPVEAVKGGKEEVLKALAQRGGAEGKALSEEALELIRRKRPLDDGLLKKIRHLLYRNRMREEANLFRQAVLQQPLMTMPDYGVAEEAEMQDTLQERWERGFQEPKTANDTDSGAGSDEDKFYQDPEKREVLEFARSQAISNIKDVAIDHASELDIPLKQELKDVAEAPPLPTEIVEEPGGAAVSTLNRYVIKTDDPAVAPAVAMNKDRMAFWKAELEGFPKSADRLRNLMQELDVLEELDENLNGVIDVFNANMKMAAISPEVTSQFKVLKKAQHGIQQAKLIQKNIQEIIKIYPEDKTAQRALKDAATMIARFQRTEKKAAAVVRRISKKEAPPALRKATAATKRALNKLLVDPSSLEVIMWQDRTAAYVGGNKWYRPQRVEGIEYQARFRTELPGKNRTWDLIVFQSTVDEKGVMLKSGTTLAEKWSVADAVKWFSNVMKGSPLLKGEDDRNAERAKVAPEIARAMEQYARSVGDTYNRSAEVDGLRITMDTRTDYDYADYGQYEEPDFPDYADGMKKALRPWAKYISRYGGGYGEKGWYEFVVVLK